MFVVPKVEKIKQKRESFGLSQHQLSLLSELSGCAISRIESGKTAHIHLLRAKAIAKALNCAVEDIFTDMKGA